MFDCDWEGNCYALRLSRLPAPIERPFIADVTRHANDPTLFGAPQRIPQGRRTYQFECFVDTPGAGLSDLFGDRAGIDEHLISAARQQQLIAFGFASRSRDECAVTLRGSSSGQADGCCASADQQTFALFRDEANETASPMTSAASPE